MLKAAKSPTSHTYCASRLFRVAPILVILSVVPILQPYAATVSGAASGFEPYPPLHTVRLAFIHHSVGYDWLRTGNLIQELNTNNYHVTETDYGWGPDDLDVYSGTIGDHTDIGHWYNWFLGPHRDTYLQELYTATYFIDENTVPDPGGENEIVMFKSCFVSILSIQGSPSDPPLPQGVANPIWGHGADEDYDGSMYTVSNIKGLYRDLLDYFSTRQDNMFVLVTSPPSTAPDTTASSAANLRAINNWLVYDWLDDYPYKNVYVFDYYNILTSNGGSYNLNDAGRETGNHHRYWKGEIQHVVNHPNNYLAYPSNGGADNHPTAAGHQKATDEFIELLNLWYNDWNQETPTTFYVSTAGDDTNDGSFNTPWRTVQHALDMVQPGQTIYIRGGVYNEYVEFRSSGLEDAPITVSGYAGELAVLDGLDLNWKYGVNLEDFDHLVLENLKIRDYIRDGVRGFGVVGWGDTDNIVLRNLDISLVGTPIKIAADGSSEVRSQIVIDGIVAGQYDGGGIDLGPGAVADVEIRGIRLAGPEDGSDTAVDGIAVESGDNVLVEKVVMTGHPGDGVDLKADHVTVRQVDVRGYARNGLKLWGTDSAVENCLFVQGELEALVLEGQGPYTIRNCAFSIAAGHGYTAVIGPYEPQQATPHTMVSLTGNIFYTPENTGTLIYFSPTVSLQSNLNIYYAPQRTDEVLAAYIDGSYATFSASDINDGTWASAVGTDAESSYADPLFVDPAAGDYQLQEGSPAIDRLPSMQAPTVDLLGRPRPSGESADIGPYEFLAEEDIYPPTTSDDYDGAWHNADFTITLTATDYGSGVAESYYRINDGSIHSVNMHGQPSITVEGADIKLEYWSVDSVGNEESPHTLTDIKLDKTRPTIGSPSRVPSGDVAKYQTVEVAVEVTDALSQVGTATLHYSLDDGMTWEEPIPMTYDTSTTSYRATIPGQQAGTSVRFKIAARDNAGNQAEQDCGAPSCTYNVSEAAPSGTIAPISLAAAAIVTLSLKSHIGKGRRCSQIQTRSPQLHQESKASHIVTRKKPRSRAPIPLPRNLPTHI